MDKQHFDQLVKGVREMKRHMAGKRVRGAKTTELSAPDVRNIREAAKISRQNTRGNELLFCTHGHTHLDLILASYLESTGPIKAR